MSFLYVMLSVFPHRFDCEKKALSFENKVKSLMSREKCAASPRSLWDLQFGKNMPFSAVFCSILASNESERNWRFVAGICNCKSSTTLICTKCPTFKFAFAFSQDEIV